MRGAVGQTAIVCTLVEPISKNKIPEVPSQHQGSFLSRLQIPDFTGSTIDTSTLRSIKAGIGNEDTRRGGKLKLVSSC